MRISDWSADVCSSDLAGGEIRSGAAVERILSSNGKVKGVVLENGDALEAPTVISNMDVRRTFLHVDAAELPGDFVKAVMRSTIRGSSEERRVGTACVSQCRSRWRPLPSQKKKP